MNLMDGLVAKLCATRALLLVPGLLVGGVILGACSSGATPSSAPTTAASHTSTTAASSGSTTAVTQPVKRHVLVATFADNGGTLTVLVNDRIRVVLAGTAWTQKSSNSSIVAATTDPKVLPTSSGCVYGQGCGSVTVFYRGLRTGDGQILGTRSNCSGANQTCTTALDSFRLKVVVTK